MKTDKILFGAACIGMGFILNSVANKSEERFSPCRNKVVPETIYVDSCKLRQPLMQDTAVFSNAIKSDSLKALKKIVK